MERLDYVQHEYQKSDQKFFQGTIQELDKEKKKGYYPISGANGSYQLSKATSADFIFQKETGEQVTVDLKEEIKDLYGKGRITEVLVNKFVKELQEGKVICQLVDTGNITVKESD